MTKKQGDKVYQAYNKRIKSWVKYKLVGGAFIPLDVKQKDPMKPFKGIPKKGQRR